MWSLGFALLKILPFRHEVSAKALDLNGITDYANDTRLDFFGAMSTTARPPIKVARDATVVGHHQYESMLMAR